MLLDLPIPYDVSEAEARLALAVGLFEEHKVSIGKASEIAGVEYHTFWDLLVEKGVPVAIYTADDVRQELENVNKIFTEHNSIRHQLSNRSHEYKTA
ncbi:hypothetical protein RsTz2092_07640 [Deferribacterales bacterium RsTz2092]|nr:hypothetical protein AGMMS49941_07530 [Deferribacterales bacterium]